MSRISLIGRLTDCVEDLVGCEREGYTQRNDEVLALIVEARQKLESAVEELEHAPVE